MLLTSSETCDVKHSFAAAKNAKNNKTTELFSIVKDLIFFYSFRALQTWELKFWRKEIVRAAISFAFLAK